MNNSATDVRKQPASAEAETREQQFRTLANSIPQLAWMADAEGYIFWYNDRWYDYTGTSLEETSASRSPFPLANRGMTRSRYEVRVENTNGSFREHCQFAMLMNV